MFLTENETKHINEVCVCVSDWVLSSLQLHTLTDNGSACCQGLPFPGGTASLLLGGRERRSMRPDLRIPSFFKFS